ncbi:MAG TPA: gliding motility protein GldM [Edaphocola sp.]|nr:gliding motility protein GldM [Edaphocola sp.]
MSIPKEPRALMIQLMYLVLTAMLALNITKEVLDAFSTINTSIEQSNVGIKEKNERTYAVFDKIADRNPDLKAKRDLLYPRALQIKEEAEKMVQYLENWKEEIVKNAGGWIEENGTRKIKVMDDINIPTRMFVEEKNGDKVKAELENFVTKVLSIHGGADTSKIRQELPIQFPAMKKTDMNPSGDWSFGTFHNIPVIAAVTLFSKWQSDVRNAEAAVVEDLMKQVGEDNFDPETIKFDGFMAVATPNISYALAGDEITATIALAAFDKSAQPTITSNVGAVSVKDGTGTLKFRAAGTAGEQTVRGTISVRGKGDKVISQPWEFKYRVGTAGASLQLDKMNVMYVGVPNPVTISASGYNLNDVSWHMEGAKITPTGPGKYNVEVTTPNYKGVPYVVTAKSKSGGNVEVARGLIRVKSIPSPVIKIGSIVGSGSMGTGEFKAQRGIIAELENFDFDFKYLVSRYTLTYIARGSDQSVDARGTGPLFDNDPAVRELINRAKPGDRYIFENITVKGSNGVERPGKGSLSVLIR